jgi:hypothetical protein
MLGWDDGFSPLLKVENVASVIVTCDMWDVVNMATSPTSFPIPKNPF